MSKKIVAVLSLLVIAVIVAAAAWQWNRQDSAGAAERDTPFVLVEAADRALDGEPALALTFSLPLNSRSSYDKYIQVFEMPLRAGEVPVKVRHGEDEDEDAQRSAGEDGNQVAHPAED